MASPEAKVLLLTTMLGALIGEVYSVANGIDPIVGLIRGGEAGAIFGAVTILGAR